MSCCSQLRLNQPSEARLSTFWPVPKKSSEGQRRPLGTVIVTVGARTVGPRVEVFGGGTLSRGVVIVEPTVLTVGTVDLLTAGTLAVGAGVLTVGTRTVGAGALTVVRVDIVDAAFAA
jgi:hypothetical protein